MIPKSLFAVLIFIGVFCEVDAQQQNWRFSGYAPHFRDYNAVQILNNGRIVAAGGNLFNDALTSFYFSDDTAATWGIGLDSINAMINDMHFPSDTVGYGVGNVGMIYKSSNQGTNWTRIPLSNPVSGRNYYGVHFTNVSTGIAVGGYDTTQTILRTVDGGTNWTTIIDAPGKVLKDVFFVDSQIGYAVGDSGTAIKTIDGGISWTPLNIPSSMQLRTLQSVYFVDQSIGFIVGGNPISVRQVLLKTVDGGVTWNTITDALGSMYNTVHFISDSIGYIGGENGLLLYTADQGTTWTSFIVPGNDVNAFNDINFLNAGFGIATGVYGKTLIYYDSLIHLPTAVINNLATIINSTTTQIDGIVNAYNLSTNVEFEYGLTSSFGTIVAMTPGLTSTNNQNVSVQVNTLVPSTIYYGRIKVSNSLGIGYSNTIVFYTDSIGGSDSLVLPPTVTINNSATIINANSVQIDGVLNAYHLTTTVEFEYGLTPSFGTLLAMTPSSTANNNQPVSILVTGLSLTNTYYGRIKVTNQLGIAYSNTIPFYTDSTSGLNFNFENWNDFSADCISNWGTGTGPQKVLSYDGSFAARLNCPDQNSVSAIFHAYDSGQGPPFLGLPFSGGRPDTLIFHAKYDIDLLDSALAEIFFNSNGVRISDTIIRITGSSGAAFQVIKIPIHYSSLSIPDSIGVLFCSTNFLSGNVDTLSEITLDNIFLSNSTSQIINSDMESWSVVTRNHAVSWYCNDDMNYHPQDSAMVRRSTNASNGNYALLLRTVSNGQQFHSAFLKSGPNVYYPGPDFPVFVRHTSFNGMYELNSPSNDTLRVMVTMFKLGMQIGSGYQYFTNQFSNYSYFNLPITYYTTDIPDSASIQFFLGKMDTTQSTGNSWALIDDLGFDGIMTSLDSTIVQNEVVAINVFPNPAQNYVNVILPETFAQQTGEIEVSIYDMTGKKCIDKSFFGKNEIQLNLEGLADDLYFIEIKTEEQTLYSKLIIKR